MCGRFLLTAPLESVRRTFAVAAPATNLAPRNNIAPTQPVCVVRLADEDAGTGTSEGGREMTMMRWGLVPSWMKEVPASRPLINARVETVAETPSFRAAYRRRKHDLMGTLCPICTTRPGGRPAAWRRRGRR